MCVMCGVSGVGCVVCFVCWFVEIWFHGGLVLNDIVYTSKNIPQNESTNDVEQ